MLALPSVCRHNGFLEEICKLTTRSYKHTLNSKKKHIKIEIFYDIISEHFFKIFNPILMNFNYE
jgi:hypothetical protein